MVSCPNLNEKKCHCEYHRKIKADRQRLYRRRRAEREHGIAHPTDLLPVGEVRRRLRQANRNGVTYREMAVLTGISQEDLQRIANPTPKRRTKRIQRKTYEAILRGLPETDLRAYQPTTLVPIKRSRQVVRSLSAQGWATDHLAEILQNNTGKSGAFIRHISGDKRVQILKQNEDRVLWLAKHIGNKEGPAKKSKTWARKRAHFPLRHYDAMGDLIESTLSDEQRAILRRVQSSHG